MAKRIGKWILITLAVFAVVFVADRTLIAWQNGVVVVPEQSFVRWPSGGLDNPLVQERLVFWDRWELACPPLPYFCIKTAHAWTRYWKAGGEVFVSFADFARLQPAVLRFKQDGDGDWHECRGPLWSNCNPALDYIPVEVRKAVEIGELFLREAGRKS